MVESPEDSGLIPCLTSKICYSSSRGSSALLWPLVHQICLRCIGIYADKTPVHIEVNNYCKSWYWLLGIVCWAFPVSAWYSQSALSPSSVYGPGSDLPGAVWIFLHTMPARISSLEHWGLLSLYLLQSSWLLSRQVSCGKATPLC